MVPCVLVCSSVIGYDFEHLFMFIRHLDFFHKIFAYNFAHFLQSYQTFLLLLIQKMLSLFGYTCYKYFLSVCDLSFLPLWCLLVKRSVFFFSLWFVLFVSYKTFVYFSVIEMFPYVSFEIFYSFCFYIQVYCSF